MTIMTERPAARRPSQGGGIRWCSSASSLRWALQWRSFVGSGEADIGLGDNLMATGMARGAQARGKRVAFGDGRRILWDSQSKEVFAHNPNIAAPGSEGASDLEWVPFYKGHRIYNRQSGDRWIWNLDFRAMPGEIFFSPSEIAIGKRRGKGFVLIEPSVPAWKSSAANKDWGWANYQTVARILEARGHRVVQFVHARGGRSLVKVDAVRTWSFRDALSILRCAAIYLGPEGGLHHAAAALGIPGVVLFGGFIPPSVTGYAIHTNLTGAAEACGSLRPCDHCKAAMAAISVQGVVEAAVAKLERTDAA